MNDDNDPRPGAMKPFQIVEYGTQRFDGMSPGQIQAMTDNAYTYQNRLNKQAQNLPQYAAMGIKAAGIMAEKLPRRQAQNQYGLNLLSGMGYTPSGAPQGMFGSGAGSAGAYGAPSGTMYAGGTPGFYSMQGAPPGTLFSGGMGPQQPQMQAGSPDDAARRQAMAAALRGR